LVLSLEKRVGSATGHFFVWNVIKSVIDARARITQIVMCCKHQMALSCRKLELHIEPVLVDSNTMCTCLRWNSVPRRPTVCVRAKQGAFVEPLSHGATGWICRH
ncbi:unnamed protein product, partial [Ectocarpus sp. 12 AP-2014]